MESETGAFIEILNNFSYGTPVSEYARRIMFKLEQTRSWNDPEIKNLLSGCRKTHRENGMLLSRLIKLRAMMKAKDYNSTTQLQRALKKKFPSSSASNDSSRKGLLEEIERSTIKGKKITKKRAEELVSSIIT